MTSVRLVEAFIEAAGLQNRRGELDLALTEVALNKQSGAALARWPGFGISPEDFAAHIGRVMTIDVSTLEAAIGRLHGLDLYLALACAQGVSRAVAAFYEHYRASIERTLARMRLPEATAADLCQRIVVRLVYPGGESPPRILSYAGQAPLTAWLAVVARRAALDERAHEDREREDDLTEARWLAATSDPELEVLKRRHRGEIAVALRLGLSRLEARHRNVLRWSVVDGLTQDAIGRFYGVNRSSVCRWINDAREALLREMHEHFRSKQQMAPDDLDSLVRLIGSQIGIALSGFEDPPPSLEG